MVTEKDKLDAGLAEVESRAPRPQDDPEWGRQADSEHVSVVEAMEALLFHEHLSAEQKVLLMILVWKGEPMTGGDLARAAGMTGRSVEYAMRLLVRIKAVTEEEAADPRVKKWVKFYAFDNTNAVAGGPLSALETTE